MTCRRPTKKINIFPLIGFFVFLILGAVYLMQINNGIMAAYEVNSLKMKIKNLKEQQEKLELKAAQLQSLQSISQRLKKLNMVSVGQISYLSSGEEGRVVAFNRK